MTTGKGSEVGASNTPSEVEASDTLSEVGASDMPKNWENVDGCCVMKVVADCSCSGGGWRLANAG